jgi:hypothetical protein
MLIAAVGKLGENMAIRRAVRLVCAAVEQGLLAFHLWDVYVNTCCAQQESDQQKMNKKKWPVIASLHATMGARCVKCAS